MANRRILANRNLAPNQEISINPYTSYNSDNINKLTRCVSYGKNVIVSGLDVSYNEHTSWCCGDNLLINQDTKEAFLENWTGNNYKAEYTPSEYSTSKTYEVGDLCHYNYIIYECITRIPYDGVNKNIWNYSKWKKIPTNSPKYSSETYDGFARYIDFVTPADDNYSYSYIETTIDNTKLKPFYDGKVSKEFQMSFALEIGCPKCIIISMNDSKVILDYPKPIKDEEGNILTYNVRFSKSFLKENLETKTLKFRIGAILDGSDSKCLLSRDITDNKITKTYVRISALVLKSVSHEISTASRFDDTYTIQSTHPSSKIKVTTGIAIKDDVLLHEMDKNWLTPGICSTINVTNPDMWIKGNPYTYEDFPHVPNLPSSEWVDNQRVFQLNNSKYQSEETKNELTASFFSTDNLKGKLVVTLTNTDINENVQTYNTRLVRDNELTYEMTTGELLDYEFTFTSFKYEDNGDLTLTHNASAGHNIPDTKKDLYGNIVYLSFRESIDVSQLKRSSEQVKTTTVNSNIFYKVVLPDSAFIGNKIGTFSVRIPAKDIPVYMIEPTTVIKAYLSVGPIKVSGDTNYYYGNCCKWAYVVLYYNYFKNPKPNVSYIGLLRESDIADTRFSDDYMILAKLRFVDAETVDLITYSERSGRQITDSKNIVYKGDSSVWGTNVPATVEEAINILASKLHSS